VYIKEAFSDYRLAISRDPVWSGYLRQGLFCQLLKANR
jgi:hypothetical protein